MTIKIKKKLKGKKARKRSDGQDDGEWTFAHVVRSVGNSLVVTLPHQIATKMQLGAGDVVRLELDEIHDRVTMTRG